MSTGQLPGSDTAFAALRQLARRQRSIERCELCGSDVGSVHPHLVEIARRKMLCACNPCAILFSGQSNPKFKRVPMRVSLLTHFHMTDAQWDALMIPINMAFFFKSSGEGRVVAIYPSPAGAVESLLGLELWRDILGENRRLDEMESDVEALLVNRVAHARGSAQAEYYLVPIDECYRLIGIIRTHWRGLSGGTEVWQELGRFFTGLKSRAGVKDEEHA